ncbi:MAG: response regulator [Lachnospiraceae bacterium]|nr:response regulator [Lachnospiraceae bacterium]
MAGIIILLFVVMFLNTYMVFRISSAQTKTSGIYLLQSFSAQLGNTINAAEERTLELALQAEPYLFDRDALRLFLFHKKENLEREHSAAYNVYAAGTGWDIIPGFEGQEDFVATERSWYTGAIKKYGTPYVTEPYVDVMSGDICYSVSVMMTDRNTVIGMDYTLDNMRSHIAQMSKNGARVAIIVSADGVIAGCTDESMVGKQLTSVMPEYAGIFTQAKNKNSVATSRFRKGFSHENLFASRSGGGWYIILAESDWELYRDNFILFFATFGINLLMIIVITLLYIQALRSRKKAEQALASKEEFLKQVTEELHAPLQRILKNSGQGMEKGQPDPLSYSENLAVIHDAGEQLSGMIHQIISWSSIVQTEEKKSREQRRGKQGFSRINTRFRTLILFLLLLVMGISIYTNITATYSWGTNLMRSEVDRYSDQFSAWVENKKAILDMFCSIISTNPDLLTDYDECVAYLDRITKQYPEISMTYMSSPRLSPQVFMNNGWIPGKDWRVESRQWYIDTMASEDGWSLSAPYFDAQTGLYCVTVSERVYDSTSQKFLGCFGIDFYMDKLVNILGNSYSGGNYAFLTDAEGNIINHPYGSYQIYPYRSTNISELNYGELQPNGTDTMLLRDYDGTWKVMIAKRDEATNFTIYYLSGVWQIYGRVFIYLLVCLFAFIFVMILVYRIITDMISWQESANQEMQEAMENALSAGKAKSRFLAQMSHEIRTPINAVLGMNEMILRESETPGIREYSANIRMAGRTLLSIINSILDFSKIEDGKMEIIPVRYDTVAFISNLVHSITGRAKEKGLDFIVEVDEELPEVLFGDDVRFTQVVMNLLTNAVKYTEKGSVTLTFAGKERTQDTIELFVCVRDTGIGIKPSDMDKLFNSFERIEEERNRNVEGTGLGMAIVTRLLKMMDSELKVDSTYGKGSAFSFRIKQKILDPAPIGKFTEHSVKSDIYKEEELKFIAPGARVLVVDDNQMNLKVAKNFLKLFSIEPELASSGAEALEKVESAKYDVVFLDHMMPGMNGVETLKRMKDGGLPDENVPVIALTANAVVGARENYLTAGFDDYLSKPIEIARLARILLHYLPEELVEVTGDDAAGDSTDEEPEILEFSPSGVEKSGAAQDDEAFIAALQKISLDTGEGMLHCAGKVSFYREMVEDFVSSQPERLSELKEALEKEDCESYEITVHSLKSSAGTIGAMKLSAMAAALEEKAGNKDVAALKEGHGELEKESIELVQNLSDLIKMFKEG